MAMTIQQIADAIPITISTINFIKPQLNPKLYPVEEYKIRNAVYYTDDSANAFIKNYKVWPRTPRGGLDIVKINAQYDTTLQQQRLDFIRGFYGRANIENSHS